MKSPKTFVDANVRNSRTWRMMICCIFYTVAFLYNPRKLAVCLIWPCTVVVASTACCVCVDQKFFYWFDCAVVGSARSLFDLYHVLVLQDRMQFGFKPTGHNRHHNMGDFTVPDFFWSYHRLWCCLFLLGMLCWGIWMAGHKRSTIIAGRDDKVVRQSPEWESNGQQLRERSWIKQGIRIDTDQSDGRSII